MAAFRSGSHRHQPRRRGALALAVAAVVVAGCGSSDSTKSVTPAPTQAAARVETQTAAPVATATAARTAAPAGTAAATATRTATATAAAASAPGIKISSPTTGQKITDADIKVATTVSNFKVLGTTVGLPDKPGQGHIHAMLDGMSMAVLTNFYTEPNFTISGLGLKPGKHTLAVILATDTHANVGEPATVEFDYQPAQARPLPAAAQSPGKPGVKLTGPSDKATVGAKFDLKVEATNFTSSCDLEGKGNVVGFGHYHVFVDPDLKAMQAGQMSMAGMIAMPCSNSIPVDLSAWKNGQHTIMVMLVNNDHTPLAGVEPAMVAVTLQGAAQ